MSASDKAKAVASGVNTEYVAAAIVLGALALLILIRIGFRGVSFGGVSVAVS